MPPETPTPAVRARDRRPVRGHRPRLRVQLGECRVDGPGVVSGLVPRFEGIDSVLLATGILGATVMPHVIYLHSALTAGRIDAADLAETRTLLRHQRVDVVVAMGIAGLVNLSMLVLAARLFFGDAVGGVDTLEGVHAALDRVAGAPVALAFAVALLASGFASSGVGTYAGQVVMQGFLRRQIPLTLRRAITMARRCSSSRSASTRRGRWS